MFDVRSWFAVLRQPPPPSGSLARGLRAIEAGRFGEAEEWLAAALAEAPDDEARAVVHNKLGVAYVAAARRDDALAAFARALDFDAACAPALANLGNMLYEDGHPLDALDYYDAAIAADESYALAHRNRGIALRKLGKRGESVSAMRKADRLESRGGRRRA